MRIVTDPAEVPLKDHAGHQRRDSLNGNRLTLERGDDRLCCDHRRLQPTNDMNAQPRPVAIPSDPHRSVTRCNAGDADGPSRVGTLQHTFDERHAFIRAEELKVIPGERWIETAPARRNRYLDLFAAPDSRISDRENWDPGERPASDEERRGGEEQRAFHHTYQYGR